MLFSEPAPFCRRDDSPHVLQKVVTLTQKINAEKLLNVVVADQLKESISPLFPLLSLSLSLSGSLSCVL